MAVNVTITVKRLDDNYFQEKTLINNSYSSTATYITNIGAITKIPERGRIEDLSSRNVHRDFVEEFSEIPFEDKFHVYRFVEEAPGKYRKRDVMFYQSSSWLTVSGFDIVIEDFEPLAGIIIEYKFTELTTEIPSS
jgi:hypothetical protein